MYHRIAVLLALSFWIATPLMAQDATEMASRVVPVTPDATTTCSYFFTVATPTSSVIPLRDCQWERSLDDTPSGHHQIFSREGYSLCNESPAASYWDYAVYGDSGNWAAPVLLSLTTNSVKISRTTADGIWTLIQTITLDKNTPGAKIAMALKNNTTTPRVAYLVRFVDPSADSFVQNYFSATTDGAFAWNPSIPFGNPIGYGLELANVGEPQFGYLQGFARTIPTGPNPCNFAGIQRETSCTSTDPWCSPMSTPSAQERSKPQPSSIAGCDDT